MDIPNILIEIRDALKTANLQAVKENTEGRVNSKKDEDLIVAWLKTQFGNHVREGSLRSFMDMEIEDSGIIHAVNIKTSYGAAPDNAFSKLGLLWAFTDLNINDYKKMNISNRVKDVKFAELIVKNKKEINRDYWYLSLDKKDFSNVLVRGVKQIEFWNKNSTNNLQIWWKKEHAVKTAKVKSFEDAYTNVIVDGVFKCWAEKSAQWANAVAYRQQYLGSP
jgi:hypothetical protein